jgi:hypothetical protein
MESRFCPASVKLKRIEDSETDSRPWGRRKPLSIEDSKPHLLTSSPIAAIASGLFSSASCLLHLESGIVHRCDFCHGGIKSANFDLAENEPSQGGI